MVTNDSIEEVRITEIEILKQDSKHFLRIGKELVEIKDFKITSSLRGGTEIEVKIELFKPEKTAGSDYFYNTTI